MITFALMALLQYGSCQASPDRSRTAEVAVDGFLEGWEKRDASPMMWVVRRGATFTVDGTSYTDRDFYDALEADTSQLQNLVILGLAKTESRIAVATRFSGGPHPEALTVLTFSQGCITGVAVHHD